MARFRRYRKYTRRNRARWCSNIQEIETQKYTAPQNGASGDSITLVSNPIQLQTAVSQIYTVKNIECSFTFSSEYFSSRYLEDLAVYIMFVPQGMNLTNDYNLQHPEYIMAYKYIGSPTLESTNNNAPGQQYQPVKIKTRLARKLNSGDQIILFWKLKNQSITENYDYEIGGLIRWWTKAN